MKVISLNFVTFVAALSSGEGIVAFGVCVCVSAEPRLHAVGGEGNALYPMLMCTFVYSFGNLCAVF